MEIVLPRNCKPPWRPERHWAAGGQRQPFLPRGTSPRANQVTCGFSARRLEPPDLGRMARFLRDFAERNQGIALIHIATHQPMIIEFQGNKSKPYQHTQQNTGPRGLKMKRKNMNSSSNQNQTSHARLLKSALITTGLLLLAVITPVRADLASNK